MASAIRSRHGETHRTGSHAGTPADPGGEAYPREEMRSDTQDHRGSESGKSGVAEWPRTGCSTASTTVSRVVIRVPPANAPDARPPARLLRPGGRGLRASARQRARSWWSATTRAASTCRTSGRSCSTGCTSGARRPRSSRWGSTSTSRSRAWPTSPARSGRSRPASDNGSLLLEAGHPVIVYPGGDEDDYRPWTERHRVDLHGRTGFVKLALRHGVPVVPLVAHGSHDAIIVLTRGEMLARVLRLDRLRINVLPIVAGPPWGIAPVQLPTWPLPAKVTARVCEPIDWSRPGPRGGRRPRDREALLRGGARADAVQPRRAGRGAAPPGRRPGRHGARPRPSP